MPHLDTVFILALASSVFACSSSSDGHANYNGGAGTGGSLPTAGASDTAGDSGASGSSAGTVGNAGGLGGAGAGAGPALAGSGGSSANAGASGASAGNGGAAQGPSCTPPADVFSPIAQLSKTGCMDAAHPTEPTARAFAYEVNSPLWSDSADKTRAFVLPAGAKIHVRDCSANASDCPNGTADEGRWDFPVGSVMIKSFFFDKKVLETRLFMHVDARNWVGYSYQWNEGQTEATLVSADGAKVSFNTGTRTVDWRYPSQMDCLNCHSTGGGSTLGPETAQLNRVVSGRNQIDRLAELGWFETAPAKPYKAALVAPYTSDAGSPPGSATIEQKARSYLHANCAFCHRPGANYHNFDLRYDTAYKDMNLCNVTAEKGAIANAPGKTKLLVPGSDTDSLLWLRMNELDPSKGRMPQIGSYVVDDAGTRAVGDWIKSLPSTCP